MTEIQDREQEVGVEVGLRIEICFLGQVSCIKEKTYQFARKSAYQCISVDFLFRTTSKFGIVT